MVWNMMLGSDKSCAEKAHRLQWTESILKKEPNILCNDIKGW